MTYLIFDLIIAALLLVALWRGYKRGFVLTLCGFLAVFVALIGASVVSNMLAGPVSRAIQPIIESSIHQVVEKHTSIPEASADGSDEEAGSADLPLRDLLLLLKDSKMYRGFADALQKAVDNGMVAATANATRVIADYVAKQIAQTVLFFVCFVLILILWFFISHALDLAFKLPVLSSLNRWSGGLLGLIKGTLLVFIACWLLKGSFLPPDAIQQTYLLKFFCSFDPLSLLP